MLAHGREPVSARCLESLWTPISVSGSVGEPAVSSREAKEGILEQDVDRLSGEPASLAAENQRPGASSPRLRGRARILVGEWDTSSDTSLTTIRTTVGVEAVMNNAG